MKKKLLSLALALLLVSTLTLTAFADGPDVSPNVPRSTKTTTASADTKELNTGVTVPANVKPTKNYTAVVGKTYKLPDAAKQTGDTYFTSNSKILTVNGTTGQFKTVANGTAYIVADACGVKRYIKVTVGTGVTGAGNKTTTGTNTGTTTTTTTGKGALAGYAVTVTNKTTLAVKFYVQTTNGVSYAYFATADNTKLGSMTEKDFKIIMDAGLKNGTISYNGDERNLWFANQFNIYRGLTGTATTEDVMVKLDLDAYAQEVIRLTNIEREKNGLPALEIDADLMDYAQTRAEELSLNYSHTRPNGENTSFSGYSILENIYRGTGGAQKAVGMWSDSLGHRSNMMNAENYAIGVGVYVAPNGNHYIVQIFAW